MELTGTKKIVGLKQVHGNRAKIVRSPSWRDVEADAALTDVPGLTLTVSFADCQNLVLYEPEKKIIGVVHAGWQGLRANVVEKTFELLKTGWGIDPAKVFVAAGPSLCTRCSEFTDPELEVPELLPFVAGKYVDLRKALESQLINAGIRKAHFERLPGCTRCQPDRFWTYRGGDREAVLEGYTNCLAATLKVQ